MLIDDIESFIKSLLNDGESHVDIQRGELAEYFDCAPSQITYVLNTRFKVARGYLVESVKGTGGYIRIMRITSIYEDELCKDIFNKIGESIRYESAKNLILDLCESDKIKPNKAAFLIVAISPQALALPLKEQNQVRAQLLKTLLLYIYNNKEE